MSAAPVTLESLSQQVKELQELVVALVNRPPATLAELKEECQRQEAEIRSRENAVKLLAAAEAETAALVLAKKQQEESLKQRVKIKASMRRGPDTKENRVKWLNAIQATPGKGGWRTKLLEEIIGRNQFPHDLKAGDRVRLLVNGVSSSLSADTELQVVESTLPWLKLRLPTASPKIKIGECFGVPPDFVEKVSAAA